MSFTSSQIRESGFIHGLADDAADEIEQLESRIAQLEEALGQTAPTASGFCSRDGGCVCGGDLPRIRESCGSWVKNGE